ncbi:hypothetical protein CEP54_013838 [Fusarium duplospermum]|uniref:Uncharacterized protein n=1 Tax=Fusarium duplospermum TaxID=1325734 RepID=A0A428P0D7_9HYPO|nr:hypothetical protein CEP54_013838 [Fusarium duplospermum]
MPEYAWAPSVDFSQDTDVVPERPVRQPIRSAGNLTAAEKAALLDIPQAGANMMPGIASTITRGNFDQLMELVFSDGWTSRIGGAKHPTLPRRQLEHCTQLVGTLKEDLPPPPGTAAADKEA